MTSRGADEVVVSAARRGRWRNDARTVALLALAAVPVALVVALAVNVTWAVAYAVLQTAFLTYGVRRRYVPKLRLGPGGLSFEPGQFQLKCGWDDVAGIDCVDLPSGATEVLMLHRSALHWAVDGATRERVRAKGWDRLVPVGDLDSAWRRGPIGEAVRRWAPAVLDEYGAEGRFTAARLAGGRRGGRGAWSRRCPHRHEPEPSSPPP